MGWFSSDETEIVKSSDNSGNINNHLVLSGNEVTYVEILLLFIALLKLAEFLFIVYTSHIRRVRKRYNGANNNLLRENI